MGPAAIDGSGRSSTTSARRFEPDVTVRQQRAPGRLQADDREDLPVARRLGHPRETFHSTGCFTQPLLREPSGADGLDDPGMDAFGTQVMAEAEEVRAGLESEDGSFLLPDRAADRAHLQGVGHDDAVEAELAAEEIRDHGSAEGARRLVEPGHADVRGHHRADARAHGRAKRQQHRGHRLVVALDGGEPEMRVLLRVAVSREVLRAGGDAGALEAHYERSDVAGYELGIAAEGTHADDRVVGVRVHVRDGGEIEVRADSGELGADRSADVPRELDVVDRAERVVAGIATPARGIEPGDVAALLVDRNEQVGTLAAQLGGQPSDLLTALDVPREEADAAEPTFEPGTQPGRDNGALEPDEQAACGEPLQLGVHPRTAPAVRPKAIFRCTRTKNTTTGSAVSVAPAIRGPQSVPREVVNDASQTVSVCFSWSLRKT